jgi:hypothetical protein
MEDTRQEGVMQFTARLSARHIRANRGRISELGVISERLVTDAFIDFLVDQLQSSTGEIAGFEWHGSGISTTAEAAGDTALISEVVTRTNGTQGEGVSSNIYNAMGVITYDGAYAITEHGLFNASTAGTLMDRSVFAAINVADGDGIEFTYELTITGS